MEHQNSFALDSSMSSQDLSPDNGTEILLASSPPSPASPPSPHRRASASSGAGLLPLPYRSHAIPPCILEDPRFEYVNEQEIEEELKCSICLEPFFCPAVCKNCRNTFCRVCVEMLSNCPLCRGEMHPLQEPPRLIFNLLAKLKVKCTTCSKHVQRGDFPSHIYYDCPIECRAGCPDRLTRATISQHKEVCPFEILPCSSSDVGCVFFGPRVQVNEHIQTCPFFALKPLLLAYQNRIVLLENRVREIERDCPGTAGTAGPPKIPITIRFKGVLKQNTEEGFDEDTKRKKRKKI
eukprot:TRINITY_DN3682_c3_g1_i1.p1 TRINITY_DN3682_c3_g1~~TRINITY_DN3682_c3_g1_i1.p1  ORF type:complete len:293 (+),score=2.34 TRINITY_DN3682_c3_g1_i1:81-959(+)